MPNDNFFESFLRAEEDGEGLVDEELADVLALLDDVGGEGSADEELTAILALPDEAKKCVRKKRARKKMCPFRGVSMTTSGLWGAKFGKHGRTHAERSLS